MAGGFFVSAVLAQILVALTLNVLGTLHSHPQSLMAQPPFTIAACSWPTVSVFIAVLAKILVALTLTFNVLSTHHSHLQSLKAQPPFTIAAG